MVYVFYKKISPQRGERTEENNERAMWSDPGAKLVVVGHSNSVSMRISWLQHASPLTSRPHHNKRPSPIILTQFIVTLFVGPPSFAFPKRNRECMNVTLLISPSQQKPPPFQYSITYHHSHSGRLLLTL